MAERVGLYEAARQARGEDPIKTLSIWRMMALSMLAENIEDNEYIRNVTGSHPERKEKQEEALRAHKRMLYYAIAIRDMIRIAAKLHEDGQTDEAKKKNLDSILSYFADLEDSLKEWWTLWGWIREHWHAELAKNSERVS